MVLCIASLFASSKEARADLPHVEGDDGSLIPTIHARAYSLLSLDPRAREPDTSQEDRALIIQRLRFGLTAWFKTVLTFEAAYDLLPIVPSGDLQSQFAVLNQGPLRLEDLDPTLHSGANWELQQNLDRLLVRAYLGSVDIQVGRQGIGFGNSRILAAADIFSPFGPGTIDTEFKRGVDAVRVSTLLGEYHSLEAIAVLRGTEFDRGIYLGRWKGSFPGIFDVDLALGASWGFPTALLDFGGTLGGAAWYLEGSARVNFEDSSDLQVRTTAGVDYEFPFKLRVTGEVHYSSVGSTSSEEFFDLLSVRGFRIGEVFLFGPIYLALAFSYELSPLARLELTSIQSLVDGTALLLPAWFYDFSEGVSVGAGAIIPVAGGENPTTLDPRSEFNLYPTIFYTDIRLVF